MFGLTRGQVAIFCFTYVAVLARRASLESWSLLKSDFQLDSGVSTAWLGVFDTLYLVSYSMGEFINGRLIDRYRPNLLVSIGLFGAGLSLIGMAVLGLLDCFMLSAFCVLWVFEGYSQAAVFPGCVKIMGKIVPMHTRGRVMGLWTSNLNVGNIFGAIFTSVFVGYGLLGWEAIIICLSLVMITSAFSLSAMKLKKEEVDEELLEKPKASFWEVLQLRGLSYYIVGYACVKFINYGYMMWFPFYMFDHGLDKITIGAVMILYDVFGALGAFLVGWISDKTHSKIIPICVLLGVAIPNTLMILLFKEEAYFMGVLAGFCNIAISNTVLGAVALSIGKENLGAVAGVLDGCASLFAGLGMMLIGLLQGLGWTYVWEAIIAANCLAFIPFILARTTE